MKPRLSVIVPVLNEAAYIQAALQSLAPLRAQGAEVIVVDGGSSDFTTQLCAGLADRVLGSPRGRATQLNTGAAAAASQVLLFLHADTRLPETALATIEDALAAGDRDWGRFDVVIQGSSAMLAVIATLMNWRSRMSGIATGDQAIFVRRDAFERVGGFPDQPLMEDVEISLRLRRHSRPACLRQRVVTSGRRWEQFGVWRTIFLMWRLRLMYWLGTPAYRLARRYR